MGKEYEHKTTIIEASDNPPFNQGIEDFVDVSKWMASGAGADTISQYSGNLFNDTFGARIQFTPSVADEDGFFHRNIPFIRERYIKFQCGYTIHIGDGTFTPKCYFMITYKTITGSRITAAIGFQIAGTASEDLQYLDSSNNWQDISTGKLFSGEINNNVWATIELWIDQKENEYARLIVGGEEFDIAGIDIGSLAPNNDYVGSGIFEFGCIDANKAGTVESYLSNWSVYGVSDTL